MDGTPLDPGQVSAVAQETLRGVAGLAPVAQVTALMVVGAVLLLWIWTRRPDHQAGVDAATLVQALNATAQAQAETAASMATIAQQVEGVAEEVRAVAEEVRGLTSIVLGAKVAA